MVIVPVGSRNAAVVFKGLTRADPTLFAIPFPEALPNIGTVSGGDPLPAASDITAVAWGSPETPASSPPFATNPWTITFEWGGPATTTGNVHALQWTPTTGIPTAYRGQGVATGVVVANGGTTNSVAIAMTAPVASTIGGTVTGLVVFATHDEEGAGASLLRSRVVIGVLHVPEESCRKCLLQASVTS